MSDVFPSWYAESASSWTLARARKFADELSSKSGSPIETLFGASILVAAYETGFPLNLECQLGGKEGFILAQQVTILKYRVDFLITGNGKRLVVECDGRDFHHATRGQIERDRLRDADLSASGYTVFRFPGKQITGDIWRTTSEVLSWLDADEYARWYRENWEYLS